MFHKMKAPIEPQEQEQEQESEMRKNVPVRTSSVTSRLTGMLTYSANSLGSYSSNQLKESYVDIENMCSQLAKKRVLCEKRLHAKNEKIALFTALHGTSQNRMLQVVQEAGYKAKLRNKALMERMGDMKDAISHVVGDVATDAGLYRAQEAYKCKLTVALPAHISALAIRESFFSQPHMQLPEQEAPSGPGISASRAHLAAAAGDGDAEQLFQMAHNRAMGWVNRVNNQKRSQSQSQSQPQSRSQSPQQKERRGQGPGQNQTGISSASSSSRSHSHSLVDSDASTVAFGIRSSTINTGYNSRSHASGSSSNNEESDMFIYSDSDNNGNSSGSHLSSNNSPRNSSSSSSSSGHKHGNGNQTDKSYSILTSDQSNLSVSNININSDSNATKHNNISRSLKLVESDLGDDSTYGNQELSDLLQEDIDINDGNRKVADATLESSLYFAFTVSGGSPSISYKVPSSPGYRPGSSSPGGTRGQRSPSPGTRLASPSVRASSTSYGAAYYGTQQGQTASSAVAMPIPGATAAAAPGGGNHPKNTEFTSLFDDDEFEEEDAVRSAPVLVDLETTMRRNK